MTVRADHDASPPVQFTCTDARTPTDLVWDVVVIGAGIGGAPLGFELSRRGRKVCFCELGLDLASDEGVVRGRALYDTVRASGRRSTDPVLRLQHGHYPDRVVLNEKPRWLTLGSGTGGGSSIFGNIMDRMFPGDFEPRSVHRNEPDAMIPERWPISYEELRPFYEEAERLLGIRGTWDPVRNEPDPGTLLPPGDLTHKERVLESALREAGLHPYQIHYSTENIAGCQGCVGYLCETGCRNDVGKVCIAPSVKRFGAGLLTRCRISRLHADGRNVREAVYRTPSGEEVALRAKVFVLAAGALASPAILLRSGLADSSGLVGRNLMFHSSDLVQVRTKARPDDRTMKHGLSCNDFYTFKGRKLGNVQFYFDKQHDFLGGTVQKIGSSLLRELARALLSPVAGVASYVGGRAIMGASILEDLPYPDNRVTLGGKGDRPVLRYRKRRELLDRASLLQDGFQERTSRTLSVRWLSRGNINPSHMCGTLRFGDDPRTSVLDATNRAHDLDNLYAVDASCFPTSSGINPSLTIAANALRVAKILDARL